MSKKNLILKIQKADIIDAVKSFTHIKGTIDKSIDDAAARLAYNEAAGDDEYHERMIARSMVKSAEALVADISDMLSGNAEVSSDFESDDSLIIITVQVDARFNSSFKTTLARLCSGYIEDKILYKWWGSLGKTDMAAQCLANINEELTSIRKCFNKLAPEDPGTTIEDTLGEITDATTSSTTETTTESTTDEDTGAVTTVETTTETVWNSDATYTTTTTTVTTTTSTDSDTGATTVVTDTVVKVSANGYDDDANTIVTTTTSETVKSVTTLTEETEEDDMTSYTTQNSTDDDGNAVVTTIKITISSGTKTTITTVTTTYPTTTTTRIVS